VPYSLEPLSADAAAAIFIVRMGMQDEFNKKLDESMRSNPSWAHLKAVQNNRVYFLEPDLFLMNPGIRTPEAMEKLYQLAYGE
uniref:ABC transporter substrate-binding protein n=1 Tax=Dialister succinatiphilus TaxID=487173 RepID=UPI00403881C1